MNAPAVVARQRLADLPLAAGRERILTLAIRTGTHSDRRRDEAGWAAVYKKNLVRAHDGAPFADPARPPVEPPSIADRDDATVARANRTSAFGKAPGGQPAQRTNAATQLGPGEIPAEIPASAGSVLEETIAQGQLGRVVTARIAPAREAPAVVGRDHES